MSQWSERYSAVVKAKRQGLLKPVGKTPCERCGAPSQAKHHDDYSRPLAVTYLCQRCHVARHKELGWGLNHPPGGMTDVMRALNVGDSFLHPTSYAMHGFAACAGIRITVKKQKSGKVRVWRIA